MDEIHKYLSKRLPNDLIKYKIDKYIGDYQKCCKKDCYKMSAYLTIEDNKVKRFCPICFSKDNESYYQRKNGYIRIKR